MKRSLPFACAALLLAGAHLRAQDVDIGGIVADTVRDAQNAPAPAAEPAPEAAPPTGQPAANASPGPDVNPADLAIAQAIMTDLGDIAAAEDLWAKEKKKSPKIKVTLKDIVPYLSPDSPVATTGGNDRAGNPVDFGTVESGPHVSSATVRTLGLSDDFWGDYAPRTSDRKPTTTQRSTTVHHEPQEKTFGRKVKDFFKGR